MLAFISQLHFPLVTWRPDLPTWDFSKLGSNLLAESPPPLYY
jgi:hypothetical protein